MTPRLLVALSTLSLGLGACFGGGDDDVPGEGSGPLTPAQQAEGCRLGCEHAVECGTTTDTVDACVAQCSTEVIPDWIRGDAYLAIMRCTAELTCTEEQVTCFPECIPTSSHVAYEARCREVLAPCAPTPQDLDGICEVSLTVDSGATDIGFFCLLTPAIIAELRACMPEGVVCDTAATCVGDVLQRHNIEF